MQSAGKWRGKYDDIKRALLVWFTQKSLQNIPLKENVKEITSKLNTKYEP